MYEYLFQNLNKYKVSGSQISACCPFHEDTTPSFSANIETGLWICHGCGERGNATSFARMMEVELNHDWSS